MLVAGGGQNGKFTPFLPETAQGSRWVSPVPALPWGRQWGGGDPTVLPDEGPWVSFAQAFPFHVTPYQSRIIAQAGMMGWGMHGGLLGICSPRGEGRKQQHVQTQLLPLLTPHSPL